MYHAVSIKSAMKKLVYVVLFLGLIGCTNTSKNEEREEDPYQRFNRGAFEFNIKLDENVLRPVAIRYKELTPDNFQKMVSNGLSNLKEPFYAVNYALRFDADNAATSLFRFGLNSTLGFFGLLDVAGDYGIPMAETSHSETLTKIGVPTGNYIYLPILGSSSVRDTIAEPVSWFADPVGYFIGPIYMLAKAAVSAVSSRAENMEFIDSSLKDVADPYSSLKSIYLQQYGVKSEAEKKQEEEEEMALLMEDEEG